MLAFLPIYPISSPSVTHQVCVGHPDPEVAGANKETRLSMMVTSRNQPALRDEFRESGYPLGILREGVSFGEVSHDAFSLVCHWGEGHGIPEK